MFTPLKFASCFLAIGLLAAGFALTGCDSLQTQKTSDEDLQVMDEDAVSAAIQNENVVLVDIRTESAYANGHLPGAIHIPIELMGFEDERLMKRDRVIVYGKGFFDAMSTAAAKKLIRLDYANVYEFRGGVDLWTDSGRTLVKSGQGRAE